MFKKVKGKVKEFLIKEDLDVVIWERMEDQDKTERDMVYRIPNSEIEMSEVKKIGVRDFERAIYFRSGKNIGILSGGIYELEKEHRNNATTIVWVDIGIASLKFGIAHGAANIFTKDDFKLGMFGEIKIKIQDAQAFINNVVTFQQKFTAEGIKEFINSLLTTAIREMVNELTMYEFIKEARRTDTKGDVETIISREFRTYGLELIGLDIINVVVPEEQQQAYNDILEQIKKKAEEIRKDIDKLKEGMKTLESKLIEYEDDWIQGKINDETYEEKSAKAKQILEERTKRVENHQAEHKKLVGR
jgi:membrane protease subunit (stomatin/prohibitin family)